jgi:hypothetical protein
VCTRGFAKIRHVEDASAIRGLVTDVMSMHSHSELRWSRFTILEFRGPSVFFHQ